MLATCSAALGIALWRTPRATPVAALAQEATHKVATLPPARRLGAILNDVTNHPYQYNAWLRSPFDYKDRERSFNMETARCLAVYLKEYHAAHNHGVAEPKPLNQQQLQTFLSAMEASKTHPAIGPLRPSIRRWLEAHVIVASTGVEERPLIEYQAGVNLMHLYDKKIALYLSTDRA